MATQPKKADRFGFRYTEEEKALIEQAAELKNTSASNFIREVSKTKALEVIQEAQSVKLTEDAWNQFCNELDRPAKVIPALQEFMREPGVFDQA